MTAYKRQKSSLSEEKLSCVMKKCKIPLELDVEKAEGLCWEHLKWLREMDRKWGR